MNINVVIHFADTQQTLTSVADSLFQRLTNSDLIPRSWATSFTDLPVLHSDTAIILIPFQILVLFSWFH